MGVIEQLIEEEGKKYKVRNAPSSATSRSAANYTDDGSIVGVINQSRSTPNPMTKSDGTEIEPDLEIRAVVDSSQTLRPAGTDDGEPSKLVHPNGNKYRVLDIHEEDSGVTVLPVIKE